MNPDQLLSEVAAVLNRLKIPYLITGGIAVVVWGRPRFTADIDLVLKLKLEQIEALITAFQKVDKTIHLDRAAIEQALATEGEFNLLHPTSGLKVDFWILKNEPFDHSRIERRIERKMEGIPIYFSSPEDLILIKLLWYKQSESTRQLEDIQSILAIQNDLDTDYIEKWSKRHETFQIWQSLQK